MEASSLLGSCMARAVEKEGCEANAHLKVSKLVELPLLLLVAGGVPGVVPTVREPIINQSTPSRGRATRIKSNLAN